MSVIRLLATSLFLTPGLLHAQSLPQTSLAVERNGTWHTWWRASDAPAEWRTALPVLTDAIEWRASSRGVDAAAIAIAGDGMAWRLNVVLVRIDPAQVRLELVESVRDAGTRGAWSIDSMPDNAVIAVNAGQFTDGAPWGWLVRDGREEQAPGTGALTMALVADTAGGIRLVHVDSIDALRRDAAVAHAFQSYPVLLESDGRVPHQLRGSERGVDVSHRDTRLAIGQLRDGRILLALTRFAALGDAAGSLPFGPTTPEMAALMGALGCSRAMLLDGGLSAQLAVRDSHGDMQRWNGWRRVPLALIAYPRSGATTASRTLGSTSRGHH